MKATTKRAGAIAVVLADRAPKSGLDADGRRDGPALSASMVSPQPVK